MLGPMLAAHPPFVGRERELAALWERLALARQGHGGVAFVAGEPGIGKTRLVLELAARARVETWLVMVGRAYDSDGMPPYLPWVEALREHVRACPATELRTQLGNGAADVALIAPDVGSRLSDLPARPSQSPEHDRYRLFESFTGFLVNIVKSRTDAAGLLLVLDDLHWSDRPTLLLLGHLARRLAATPILIVGTYRTVDLDRTHPFSAVLADLSRERLSERVLLRPFSIAEAATLVEELTGVPAAPVVIEAIYRETEGNPFFLEEVVRHLGAEGRDITDPRSVPARWDIPEGVRQVLGRRLSRLSPVANQLLQIAAVLGDGFRFDVLAVASGVDTGPLVDALEETVTAGVIREENGRYHFTHALIRQTANHEMSAPRRAGLHRRVGQALERLHGGHSEPHLAELAHHFCNGAQIEDLPKTIDYARGAAERAVSLLAYEEAARLHQLALQALDLADAPDEAQQGELLLALGEARRKAGQLSEAMQAFQRAAGVARASGDTERLARAALGYEDALLPTGLPRAPAGDPSALLLEEALRALPLDEGVLRARILAGLGRALYFAGAGGRAAALNDEAVATARRVGDAGALAYALNTRCMAVWAHEDPAARLATATELLRLAEEVGDREIALEGRRWRLYALLDMGDTEAVDTQIENYARVAAELRQPQYLSHVALWRAMRALMDGRFAEVETLTKEMLETGRRAQRREADLTFVAQMFVLHRDRGDLAQLADLEPMVREQADGNEAHPVRRARLACLHMVLGRPVEARAEFERLARRDFTDLPRDLAWLFTVAELVEVCAYLGDARRAAALYELMRPYERWNVGSNGVVCPGPVSHYLGLAAGTLGRWDDALAHFQTAAALARRMGAWPVLGRTLEAHAAALHARNRGKDAARARELLEQALAIFDERMMSGDVARTRTRLAELWPTGWASRPTRPSGLTEREVDVLRLIAAGRSNREIADELTLSVRTIERHITNLYGKIDARGRADATAYAFRHDLI
ncbi:MAG TPA: AAA family ATPase [Thermomicrobiales bacterium]|nr:AAA family ATPase [Thermomicrobiales bacterium]